MWRSASRRKASVSRSTRRRLVALTALVLLAGGCTTISSVGLRHPRTGQTVRCEGYWYWNLNTREAQEQEAKQQRCIDDYEREGYARVSP